MLWLAFRKPPSSSYGLYGPALGSRLHCGRLINDKSPKSFLSANANACQFGLLTLLRLVRRAWPARHSDRQTHGKKKVCNVPHFFSLCMFSWLLLAYFPAGIPKGFHEWKPKPARFRNKFARGQAEVAIEAAWMIVAIEVSNSCFVID